MLLTQVWCLTWHLTHHVFWFKKKYLWKLCSSDKSRLRQEDWVERVRSRIAEAADWARCSRPPPHELGFPAPGGGSQGPPGICKPSSESGAYKTTPHGSVEISRSNFGIPRWHSSQDTTQRRREVQLICSAVWCVCNNHRPDLPPSNIKALQSGGFVSFLWAVPDRAAWAKTRSTRWSPASYPPWRHGCPRPPCLKEI